MYLGSEKKTSAGKSPSLLKVCHVGVITVTGVRRGTVCYVGRVTRYGRGKVIWVHQWVYRDLSTFCYFINY
jgi:hypothetical protein